MMLSAKPVRVLGTEGLEEKEIHTMGIVSGNKRELVAVRGGRKGDSWPDCTLWPRPGPDPRWLRVNL